MYDFVTGPLAWLTFIVFFGGLIWRFVWYVKGLNWQADRVAYTQHIGYGVKGAARSIVSWLIPYGTNSWRFYPGFTILVFVFHLGLLITPIFLLGHNLLLQERWGFSLPTIPEPSRRSASSPSLTTFWSWPSPWRRLLQGFARTTRWAATIIPG